MNIDLDNIKTEFEDYKEQQQYFKLVAKKQKQGKYIWNSREKVVAGGYIGNTYKKEKNKAGE